MTGSPVVAVECGAGPAVLLVHGQPGRGDDWGPVAGLLAAGHRVIVPDRPGWGATGGAGRGLAGNAEALVGLLAERGALPATVVGHSFGGGVALALARRHPEAVRSLVLVASVGTGTALGVIDRLLATAAATSQAGRAAWAAARGLGAPPWRPRHRVSPLGGPPARLPARWATFGVEQRALLVETPALEAALPTLSVPTAVVAGQRDRIVPPRAARDLSAAIPGAELVWVGAAGHRLPRRAPAALAAVIHRYAGDFGRRDDSEV